jgi:hypothetical protein
LLENICEPTDLQRKQTRCNDPATDARRKEPMPVNWNELLNTFDFVSLGQPDEHQAVLCRESGKFLWYSDLMDDRDEWPDDADDEENISGYLIRRNSISASLWYSTSSKSFYRTNSITCGGYSSARAHTPVSRICCNERMLDRWHDFETKATEKALKEWCDVNDVAIDGRDREAPGPDHH